MSLKAQFFADLVRSGVTLPNEEVSQLGRMTQMYHKFQKVELPSGQGRFINRFKIGGDPEFIFMNEGQRVNASAFKLKTAIFAGADSNGRLVEVRPRANRSTLIVVASILSELRFLARFWPATLGHEWVTGGWLLDDGIGGHVHFGRKRPTRPNEINALDAMYFVLMDLGVLPVKEQLRRQQGDRFGQRYGQPGDIRLQKHGYEYRTLPSYLDSPWMAFFVLTLAKLAVVNPYLLTGWHEMVTKNNLGLVRNLLAYYKGRDDDAMLCHYLLAKRGIPKHFGGDFRERWGLNFTTLHPVEADYFPASIAPSREEVGELFEHLVNRTALKPKEVEPTWQTHVPKGFVWMMSDYDIATNGMGELVHDGVRPREIPFDINPMDNGKWAMYVPPKLASMLPKDWLKRIAAMNPQFHVRIKSDPENRVFISKKWRDPSLSAATRKILFSGVFPIWKINQASPELLREWVQTTRVQPKWSGTVLYQKES